MEGIKFKAAYGDQIKQVDIMCHSGGDGGYHVYIDKFYNAVLFMRDGKWVGFPNERSLIDAADIGILGDIIDGRRLL